MELRLKRVRDDAAESDGWRVLVDRLWPRGVTKERATLDAWAKDAAPSNDLRRQFHHDGLAWSEFERRYRAELTGDAGSAAIAALRHELAEHAVVTLLYDAHDPEHNNAVILADVLRAG
ncbi:DUF488 domain-containing protein [Microbacterium sp.]|uniref:DUF488 domain-containing protein n=1 Tax=Microbacterium sp. TaxID=51671 RepID=UPI003C7096D8